MSFEVKNEYSPMRIIIKGKIVNRKTGKPLKRTNIYLDGKAMQEINFYPDDLLFDTDKTNRKGEFLIVTYIDKNDLHLWLKIEEFAQLNILIANLDTTSSYETIDLGLIYFVPYDNELEIED